jgi:hypothetical protein
VLAFLKTSFPKTAAAFAAAVFLAGCFPDTGLSPNPVDPAGESAVMNIRMNMKAVNSLKKGSAISLSQMIVVIVSQGATPADTIRDTIKTSGTTPTLSADAATQQSVNKTYPLKALRGWKIYVSVRDTRDSLIHFDSATTPVLHVADTAVVNLGLTSRYSMYDAKFLSLPDKISSTTGDVEQDLNVTRLVFKVDGVALRDSTANPGPYFTSLTEHVLSYDYVRPGTRLITLEVYGPIGSSPTPQLLYSGSQSATIAAGVNSTVPITLNWVGPTGGTGSISATLGKVGKVTINGTLPGTIVP